MPDTDTASPRPPARVFAALGDQTRLSLIARLGEGRPRSIAELSQGYDLTRQAITKHLQILERADIVRGVKVGREKRFALNPRPIQALRDYLDAVSRNWDTTLVRLKSFVEE